MRQLIRTYSITGNHEITVTGYTFTKQDIRLIIDETLASAAITTEDLVASVLVSSTKKGNVVTVQNGVITLANTTANLTVGDELTIEIDIDNVAKESNATTNKLAILDALAAAKLAIQGNDATATLLALKTAIANLPTVALIQNGLAKTTEITEALDSIDDKIDNISTELEDVAQEATLTQGVQDIRDDISNIDTSDLAKEASVKDGNDTVIAVTKAIQDAVGSAPSGSEITTLFAWLTTIYEYLAGQTPEDIPEGLGDRINLLLQFFGIAGTYEAEAVGQETTDNTVINECKTRYAEVFGDLLPSGFIMPNSVTIDGTTYTGSIE